MKAKEKLINIIAVTVNAFLREIVLEGSPSNTISLHDLAYAQ